MNSIQSKYSKQLHVGFSYRHFCFQRKQRIIFVYCSENKGTSQCLLRIRMDPSKH